MNCKRENVRRTRLPCLLLKIANPTQQRSFFHPSILESLETEQKEIRSSLLMKMIMRSCCFETCYEWKLLYDRMVYTQRERHSVPDFDSHNLSFVRNFNPISLWILSSYFLDYTAMLAMLSKIIKLVKNMSSCVSEFKAITYSAINTMNNVYPEYLVPNEEEQAGRNPDQ